jgi:hypothetical protein
MWLFRANQARGSRLQEDLEQQDDQADHETAENGERE